MPFRIGDAVIVDDDFDGGGLIGFIQCCGDKMFGVRLMGNSAGRGDSDGSFKGTRYFHCQPKNATFVDPSRITKRYMSRMDQLKMKRELAASIHYNMKHYQQEVQKLKTGCELLDAGKTEKSQVTKRDATIVIKAESESNSRESHVAKERELREERQQNQATTENKHLLHVALETKQQHIDNLRSALTKSELKNSELAARAAAVEEKIKESKACIKERESPEEREQQNQANGEKNHILQVVLETKQQQVDNLRTELTEAELKNSELAAHASAVEESNTVLNALVKDLEAKHSQEIKKLEKSFEESKTVNAKLQNRISELKETSKREAEKLIIQKSVSGSEELQNRIEETKERSMKMKKLETYLLDCQSVQNQLLDQIIFDDQQLQHEKEKEQSNDQKLDKAIHFKKLVHVLNENQRLNQQNSSIQNKNTALKDQVDRLEKSLATAKARSEKLQKRADSVEQQNGRLEARISQLKNTNQQYEKDQKEVADLRRFLSFSRFLNRELKGKISKLEEEKQTQVTKLEQALLKSKTYQNKIKEREEKLEQRNRKLRDYVRREQDTKRKMEGIIVQLSTAPENFSNTSNIIRKEEIGLAL